MTGVALIDYGAGNLRSVENALRTAGAGDIAVTADPARVSGADRIVLPGVGAFAHCMASLSAIPGMVDALSDAVLRRERPFLGICVGMQLLADRGHEHGVTAGLGWIGGDVRPLAAATPDIRIPHMGWNRITPTGPTSLVEAGEGYFLHGYHFDAADAGDIAATSAHGQPIVAAVQRGNIAGVQFHPEKSQAYGIALLRRFLNWRP